MVITIFSPEGALTVSSVEASRTREEEGVATELPRITTETKADAL